MQAAPGQLPLDDTDRAILQAITSDADITNKALAHRLGLAESTCAHRVRQLRRAGVLDGSRAELNLAALGYPLQAVISVRLGTHSEAAVNEFFDSIVEVPGVLQVFFVSGSADFLVHVAVRDTSELRDMVLKHITTHRAVRQAETHLAFESRRGLGVILRR